MTSQPSLHRARLYLIDPPRFGPSLAGFLFCLGLTGFFGAGAVLVLTREHLWQMVRLPWEEQLTVRWLGFLMGTVCCLASALVALAFGIRLFAVLSHRMGWHPIVESEGPCRLVQDAAGLWGLQVELAAGSDPRAAWPLTTERRVPAGGHVLFRLDEATAGAVSHLTSPDEPLALRWINLPLPMGGPTLLEVRSPRREAATGEDAEEIPRAA